jgi:MFS family permease
VAGAMLGAMTKDQRSATPTDRLHPNVWVASATSFLTDVSSEMILNVLPLFLANVLGVRIWAVGAVEGLADTTASAVKLYSGWLADRLRARKWLAVTGYAVSASMKPFYLGVTSWTGVAGIRFGDRVGKGIRTAPRDALLADSAPPGKRGLVFGLHRAADTGGAVVGLLITIWVVQRFQGENSLLLDETFRSLVRWSLLPAFLAVALLAVGARDVVQPDDSGPRPRVRLRGLGRPFAWFVVCSTLFELGNSADAFLILRAQERGLSVLGVLWVLLAFNVVYTLVAAPAGALSDRIGRRGVIVTGWILYSLCYAGFAVATTTGHVVVLYLVYGAYHGIAAGAAKALVPDLVPPHLVALAYGGYAAVVGVVSLPASLLAGVLWEGLGSWSGLGPSAPFAFGAVTGALASALLLLFVEPAPVQPSPSVRLAK